MKLNYCLIFWNVNVGTTYLWKYRRSVFQIFFRSYFSGVKYDLLWLRVSPIHWKGLSVSIPLWLDTELGSVRIKERKYWVEPKRLRREAGRPFRQSYPIKTSETNGNRSETPHRGLGPGPVSLRNHTSPVPSLNEKRETSKWLFNWVLYIYWFSLPYI